jgi:hypothetical protein
MDRQGTKVVAFQRLKYVGETFFGLIYHRAKRSNLIVRIEIIMLDKAVQFFFLR